jgi:diguanylate cyclase (GGDEF)-like protein
VSEGFLARFFALICAAAAFVGGVCAQDTHLSFPDHARYAVARLDQQFGLDAVTVTAMAQDRQGFLWIGTQTGLYRYDGARAQKMEEVESIIGHYVVDSLIAPDGTAWFAGNHGIAHYHDSQFERLSIPPTVAPLSTGNQIFAIDSHGIVYVLLFNRGILRIDPKNPAQFKVIGEGEDLQENIEGIVRGVDDSIWFTFGRSLGRILPGTTKIEMDRVIQLPRERVAALIFDGTQTMWVRTAGHLARIDPRMHKIRYETAVVGTANEEEGKPIIDRQGRLLVPSSTGLYWQEEGRWRLLTDKQGLTSNDVQFALEDHEGSLWVAGSGTGVDRLPGVHEWTAWTTSEGLLDNSTWSTLRDAQGRMWVSTGHGIGVWDGQKHAWLRVPTLNQEQDRGIRQIQRSADDSVWAVTGTGALVRISAKDFSKSTYPSYKGQSFLTIQPSPDGDILASTRTRLVRFNGKGHPEKKTDIPLPIGETGEIDYLSFAPSGVLWASGPGVLYRFDGKNWRVFKESDGLLGQNITSVVAVSNDEVWIAYNDVVGVTRVLLNQKGEARFVQYQWDWMILCRDSWDRIWFNGPDGLAVRTTSGRIQHLSRADGLIWNDVSPYNGVREEVDGSFVIATSRGLARYREGNEKVTEARPTVVLTSVSLGGQERRTGAKVEVPASDGNLTVQFAPLVLDTPERVSCRYLLNGLETQATMTTLREVHYGALPAGDYEFSVKCQRENSGLISEPASFHFRVLPSTWQTWWARLLEGAGLLLCFWIFVSLRTRALNHRQLELEQAVAQRSAELVQKNKELEEISLTDPLTCTRNRRYFYETISTDIAQALRSHLKTTEPEAVQMPRQELIFVLVDIDRFKRVNDELGHAAGDHLLQEVAKRIAAVMRRSDDLVRWGGEEFLLVCRTTDREHASLLCERVLEAVREIPFDVGNGVQVNKTCSIGWAPFPWIREDVGLLSIDNVIELADKALYLAKREGRNRSYGMLPAPGIYGSDKSVSIEYLRDCPPELVQIV